MKENYERLGLFYLGRELDPATILEKAKQPPVAQPEAEGSRELSDNPYYLLRSKDLLTHALCVGMTGSGKTGLCTAILEEAAIDGIPAIVIDLKGDLTNLCLSFDPLTETELLPWVRSRDAEQAGLSRAEFARAEAARWNAGLAQDDQSTARVRLWRESSELAIYTPGLAQLTPLSVVNSFACPPAETLEDLEAVSDLAGGYATAILALIGHHADPLEDREHILLSQILLTLWAKGQSPELADLISLVQEPPFTQLGVMDLDAFFPAKDRFNLALNLNKLLAAPSFSAWLEGEPMEIDRLLYSADGKARCSIISLQHLNESERTFFLTLLLNQLLAWSRRQKGTQALRALFYMDEIQGYFPPVAEPPTKKPLLTLLKQARAFGLGLILATQNPVDLDYKGLSNIGLWLVGRLQTERDRSKVLEGLKASLAAADGVELKDLDRILAALPKRQFIARNVHREGLTLFRSRHCLSYLAGPLSRNELAELAEVQRMIKERKSEQEDARNLTALERTFRNPEPAGQHFTPEKQAEDPELKLAGAEPTGLDRAESARAEVQEQSERTVDKAGAIGSLARIKTQIPESIPAYYLPQPGDRGKKLRPMLYALTEVFYEDKTRGVRQEKEMIFLNEFNSGVIPVDWAAARELEIPVDDLEDLPEADYSYADLPELARDPKAYTQWTKDLVDYLYKQSSYKILENKKFKVVAEAGETAREFAQRLQQELRDERERALDEFEAKFRTRLKTLERRKLTAEQRVEREEEQARDAKNQTWISLGNAIFSTVFGQKKISSGNIGKMATASRSASRAKKQKSDISRAEEQLAKVLEEEELIRGEIEDGLNELGQRFDSDLQKISERELRPLKRDCKVKLLALVWTAL
ncbi:MAG: hypothetical protein Q4P08_00395 [Eubacteriales bacterium]|nr:hypothetical protein [Eubacteriales bacterium]